MDSLVTVLAGIIVLALPFAVWLRFKIRTQREKEIEKIKTLAAERSRWLDELHSRLDALDEQESRRKSAAQEPQREPVAIEDAALALDTLRLLQFLAAHQATFERDAAVERYLTTLKALELGTERLVSSGTHHGKMYRRYAEEAKVAPGWAKAEEPNEAASAEYLRWEDVRQRMNRRPLRGPTLQAS